MHREFRPQDMQQLDADPFTGATPEADSQEASGLYLFTALLGLLIGGDVLLGVAGLGAWRLPGGISLSLVAALLGAVYIVYGALEALLHGRIGADCALAQACIAALVLGQPFVAAEVVFIALVGEVLEAVTFSRTKRAVRSLVDQTPRTARVRRDGVEIEIPARDVTAGELVIVRPGERIPVDGPVVAGRSTVDQSALTGESIPVDKGPSDQVFTGTLNQFGVIEVHAQKVGSATTFGQVVRMVAQAHGRKADLERVADRLARYFLPAVEIAAAVTLAAGYLLGWPDVWSRTVAVLVVACPCALVLATPAAMLASMAWLARHGILIKGGYAARAPGCLRHVRLRQDGNSDRGQSSARQPGRNAGARSRSGTPPGGLGRAGQRAPPGARRGRRGTGDAGSTSCRPPMFASFPEPEWRAWSLDPAQSHSGFWSAIGGCWLSTS